MNSEEFVKMIKLYVRDAAVEDSISKLEKPPGRKPRQRHLNQSEWYNKLSEENKVMFKSIIEEAIDESLFGFLSVLDGVRVIEDGESRGTLKLSYQNKNEKILLNNPDKEYLHDIYNYLGFDCKNIKRSLQRGS